MQKSMLSPNIAIYPSEPNLHIAAEKLAKDLNIPLTLNHDLIYSYLLILTPDYLGLQKNDGKSSPLVIDFLSKPLQYRSKNTSLRKEALARAMGLKNYTQPTLLDATGGLGRDSFMIASLGFDIEIIERSPIIYALLKDGIERAKGHAAVDRMHLKWGDAISYLNELKEKPEIIYLDPMFPEKKKSALPKQNMLIFHDIVGDDTDAETLLAMALTCATRRVVVKRPRLATIIPAVREPSFSLKGSSSRFDVYLI